MKEIEIGHKLLKHARIAHDRKLFFLAIKRYKTALQEFNKVTRINPIFAAIQQIKTLIHKLIAEARYEYYKRFRNSFLLNLCNKDPKKISKKEVIKGLYIALVKYKNLDEPLKKTVLELIQQLLKIYPEGVLEINYYKNKEEFVTNLCYAIKYNLGLKVVKLLLKFLNGNRSPIEEEFGKIVLHTANSEKPIFITYIKLLVAIPNFNVNVPNKDGIRPLDLLFTEILVQDQEEVDESVLQRCNELLQLLLSKGSNPSLRFAFLIHEEEIQVSTLHLVAARGYYHELKLMLNAAIGNPNIDINVRDSREWTPLDYAAHYGQYDCVYLLLRQHNIDHTVTASIDDQDIGKLIQQKRQERKMLVEGREHWVKTLNFSYVRRDTKRSIYTENDKCHLVLRAACQRKPKARENTNHAAATLNFIVTNGEHTDEYSVDVTALEKYENISTIFTDGKGNIDKEGYIKYLQHIGVKPTEFQINAVEKAVSRAPEDILREDKFEVVCLHSEQALFAILQVKRDVLDNIAQRLIEQLNHVDRVKYKVVGITLNIHTDKYMCQECRSVAMAFQVNGIFKKVLAECLEKYNVRMKPEIPVAVAISADKPFILKLRDYRPKQCKVKVHQDVEVDLRTLPQGHLFFRDLSEVDFDMAIFKSGKQTVDLDKKSGSGTLVAQSANSGGSVERKESKRSPAKKD